ncbi:MAG: hypothetical protein ACUVXD_03590 [Thermodesulfobacteriota bacterium]
MLALHAARFREGAVSYAVELASRMNLSLILMLVSAGKSSAKAHDALERLWVDRVMKQCRDHGVTVEVFVGAGSLCEEVLRFVGTHPAAEFVVMDFSDATAAPGSLKDPLEALHRLGEEFEGEVLLVSNRGNILRLKDVSCNDISNRR